MNGASAQLLRAQTRDLRLFGKAHRTRNNSHPLTSYFGPAEAERLRFLAGGSGAEPFSPTVRLGDSELRVRLFLSSCDL